MCANTATMAESSDRVLPRPLRYAALIVVGVVFVWVFPLFHVKRLSGPGTETPVAVAGVFDPKTAAEKFWQERLMPAVGRAADLARVVQAVRENPESARKSFG